MKTIYKYQLDVTGTQLIKMPVGADPFTAEFQGNLLCIWAAVNSKEEEFEDREFRIFGTGEHLNMTGGVFRFLNTVHHESGVWHIFARIPNNG